jgi:superfamily I DNA/RNA helicase
MKSMIPSKYQEAIYQWVKTGTGDCVVQATAGSGKTSSLVEVANKLHTDNAIFLAFNKHIVEELQKRLPEKMAVKTIHSVGYGSLMKTGKKFKSPSDSKYRNICKNIASDFVFRNPSIDVDPYALTEQLQTVSNFVRLTLTDYNNSDALWEMIDHFGLEVADYKIVLSLVSQVIIEGDTRAKYSQEIDFTDMLWLPHSWRLQPRQFEWVLIDECQDLSEAQLRLALKCRAKGGRMIFVGDPRQAIFSFAGANNDSIDQIIDTTGATVLPLSICYRCPRSHIELAKRIAPEIEAREDAPEGILERILEPTLPGMIEEGDVILCRMTSPLIELCIQLISKKIPARVKGKDIGKQLTSIVEDVAAMPGFIYDDFGLFLKDYVTIKIAKLRQRDNSEQLIESLTDKCLGIQVCYETFDCNDIKCLCKEIDELFSDGRPSVTLSVVHRYKGSQNKRIFIIKPDKLPLRWKGQKEHEYIQEKNLQFVALTRATESLYFVDEPDDSKSTSVGRQQSEDDESDF